jgi:RNA polymerase sigma factor (sigma-70 family)
LDDAATWWIEIAAAGRGEARARDGLTARYLPMVRAYFGRRWQAPALREQADDAVQEAFLELFRAGGALERVDPGRSGGFRAYLAGVLRHVALRFEERWARARARAGPTDAVESVLDDETTLSAVLDREWARALAREAGARMADLAARADEAAVRRVELLRLRFRDGLPIRTIAARWGMDAARLHHEYARARTEFLGALRAVIAERQGGTAAEVEAACRALADVL